MTQLKNGDPIAAPDGTWCIWGEGLPLLWGSSQQTVLSAVSLALGSHTRAVEEMARGARRWTQLATQAPAVHRMLTKKLKPLSCASPVSAEAELWVTPPPAPPPAPPASPPSRAPHTPKQRTPRPAPVPQPSAKERALAAWSEGMSPEQLAAAARIAVTFARRVMVEQGWWVIPQPIPAPAAKVARAPKVAAPKTPRPQAEQTKAQQAQAEGRERSTALRKAKSAERREAVARMVGEGRADKEIAAALGLSESRIRLMRQEAGLLRREAVGRLSDEERALCVTLRAQGLSVTAIMAKTGRVRTSVLKAIAGVEPPTPPAAPRKRHVHPEAEERKAQAVELHEAGKTDQEIAGLLGWSHKHTRRVLVAAGVYDPQRRACKQEEEIEQMLKLYNSGLSLERVAERIGVAKATVQRHVKAAGISRRLGVEYALSDEAVRSVIVQWQDGATISDLARSFEVSRCTINGVLERQGLIVGTTREELTQWDRQVYALIAGGASVVEAAAQFDAGLGRIYKALRRGGHTVASLQGQPAATPILRGTRRFDDAMREEIAQRYRDGETITDLAKAYTCSGSTVSLLLRALGVKTRGPKDYSKEAA